MVRRAPLKVEPCLVPITTPYRSAKNWFIRSSTLKALMRHISLEKTGSRGADLDHWATNPRQQWGFTKSCILRAWPKIVSFHPENEFKARR